MSGLRHDAFMYADERDYVAGVVPFILAGCEADQPVLVAVPSPNLDGLREHLDSDDDQVAFVDMVMLGRNPGRIIPPCRSSSTSIPGSARASSASRSGPVAPRPSWTRPPATRP